MHHNTTHSTQYKTTRTRTHHTSFPPSGRGRGLCVVCGWLCCAESTVRWRVWLERHNCQMITQVSQSDPNAYENLLWTKKETNLLDVHIVCTVANCLIICVRGVVFHGTTR